MRLFTLRGPVIRMPWPLVVLGWLLVTLWGLLRWLAAHGVATVAMLGVAGLWWLVSAGHWLPLLMVVGAALMGAGAAMELNPPWWRRLSTEVASWRRRRWFLTQWDTAMDGAGLSRGDDMPTLMAHRYGGAPGERDLDVLTVHMLPGQIVADWRAVQVRLAAAWGLQRLRCHPVPGQPGDVQLYGRRFGLSASAQTRWQERGTAHPSVQPAEQSTLRVVPPSTPVEEPVEERRGAFPRQPRKAEQ